MNIDAILLDHCYPKSWAAPPEAKPFKPQLRIFAPKKAASRQYANVVSNAIIDVMDDSLPVNTCDSITDEELNILGDLGRDESTQDEADWSTVLDQVPSEVRAVAEILLAHLDTYHLVRMVGVSSVRRRSALMSTASRLRTSLSSRTRHLRSLHRLFLAVAPPHILLSYLDLLNMFRLSHSTIFKAACANDEEALSVVLARLPFQPVLYRPPPLVASHTPLERIHQVVIVTHSPHADWVSDPRLAFISSFFSRFGEVSIAKAPWRTGLPLRVWCELLVSEAARLVKSAATILVGFSSSCQVAVEVAAVQKRKVSSLILLDYAFLTTAGSRGHKDDAIWCCHAPIMFVCGGLSASADVDQLEMMRDRLVVPNKSVVVAAAGDQLLLQPDVAYAEQYVQEDVDLKVLTAVEDFLLSVLNRSLAEQLSASVSKKRKREPLCVDITQPHTKKVAHQSVSAASRLGKPHQVSPVAAASSAAGFRSVSARPTDLVPTAVDCLSPPIDSAGEELGESWSSSSLAAVNLISTLKSPFHAID